MAADMGFMHRPVELLANPKKLQKSARSVVSLGVSYYPGEHHQNAGAAGGWRGTPGGGTTTRS
jgi:epoxyqueuosine reductase